MIMLIISIKYIIIVNNFNFNKISCFKTLKNDQIITSISYKLELI